MSEGEKGQSLLVDLKLLKTITRQPPMLLLKTFSKFWNLHIHYIPTKIISSSRRRYSHYCSLIILDGKKVLATGSGLGRLAFEAKSKAAKSLLQKLLGPLVTPADTSKVFDNPIIETLHSVCEIHGIGEPEFELTNRERRYTIYASVLHDRHAGFGRNLEDACIDAAGKLLKELQDKYSIIASRRETSVTTGKLS